MAAAADAKPAKTKEVVSLMQSEEGKEELEKVFNNFDVNNNGYIEAEEMKNACTDMNVPDLDMAQFDPDNSGKVTIEQFRKGLANIMGKTINKGEITRAFKNINKEA